MKKQANLGNRQPQVLSKRTTQLAKQRSINNNTNSEIQSGRLQQQNHHQQSLDNQIVTTFNVDKALQTRARMTIENSQSSNQRVLKSQQISHRVSHNVSKDKFEGEQCSDLNEQEGAAGMVQGRGYPKTQQNSRRQSQARSSMQNQGVNSIPNENRSLAGGVLMNRAVATANASFRGGGGGDPGNHDSLVSFDTQKQAIGNKLKNNQKGQSSRTGNSGLTEMQAKAVSQKSKMTQGLLKKLKQSIADRADVVVPSQSQGEASTVLGPNQSMLTSAGTLSRTQQNTNQKGSSQQAATSLNYRIENNIASVRSSIDREASQQAIKSFKNSKIVQNNDGLRHFQTLAKDPAQNGAQNKLKQSSTMDQRVFGAKNLSLQYKTSQKQHQKFDQDDFGSKVSIDQRHRTRPQSKDSKHQLQMAVVNQKRKSVNQTLKESSKMVGSKTIPQNFNQAQLQQEQIKKGAKIKFGQVDGKLFKSTNKKEFKELVNKLSLIPKQQLSRVQQIANPKLIVPNAVLANAVDRSKTAGNSLAHSQIQSRQASLGARSFGTIANQMTDPAAQKVFQEQKTLDIKRMEADFTSADRQKGFKRPEVVKPLKIKSSQLRGIEEISASGTHRVPVLKKDHQQNMVKKAIGSKTRTPASFRSITGVKAPQRQTFVSQQNSKLRLSGVNSPERSLQASKQVKEALKKFVKTDSAVNKQKSKILTKFETFDNKVRKENKKGTCGQQPYTSKKIPQSIHQQESNDSKNPLQIRHRRSMSLKANENSAGQSNASGAFEGVRSSHPNPTQIKQSLMEIPKESLQDFRVQIRVQSVERKSNKEIAENKRQINNLKKPSNTAVVSPTAAKRQLGILNQKKNAKKTQKDQITPNMAQMAENVVRNKISNNSRQSKLKKNSLAQSTDIESKDMQKLLKSFFTHFDTKKGSFQNQVSQKSLNNQQAWPLNQQFLTSEERNKVGCLTQSSRTKNHPEVPVSNGQNTQLSFGPDTGSVSRKGQQFDSSIRQKQPSDSMKNIQISGPQIRVDSRRVQNAGSNMGANQVSGSGQTIQGGIKVIKKEKLPKNGIIVSPKNQNKQILSRAQIALQANLQSVGGSFEEQQTLKRGDQILPNQQQNRSSQGSSKQIIREPKSGQSHVVQAFDEYIKEKRGSQINQKDSHEKLLSASISQKEQLSGAQADSGKFISDFEPQSFKDSNAIQEKNSSIIDQKQRKAKKDNGGIRDFGVNFYPEKQQSNRVSPFSSLSPSQNKGALVIQDNWDGSRNEKQSQNFFDRQIELKMQEQQSEDHNRIQNVSRASLEEEDGVEGGIAKSIDIGDLQQQSNQQPQVADLCTEDYYDEEEMPSEPFDPLLEDKQYLVTMIVQQIQQQGQPVVTTHEFYRLGNKLGQGAFGVVCVAQHKLTGHFVAVKCLRKKDLDKQIDCKRKVAQEMQNLQHLTSHRNLVKLYDSFETESHLCFVMELCAGGDLLSYVRMRKRLSETVAKYFFKQIALAIAYSHKNLVVHRDIKLENLLLDEEGVLKLCDLGVSSRLETKDALLNDQCGTPAYMAPEVYLNSKPYSGQAADIWSLGVCLYAMLFGLVPFKGKSMEELRNAVISHELDFPESDQKNPVSSQAKLIVKRLLAKDPDQRLTIKQVLKSGWLKDVPKGGLKIFTDSELKKIKTLSQPANGGDEPQRLLTEVALTLPTQQSALKKNAKNELENTSNPKDCFDFMPPQNSANITQKSCILAPFNSTLKSTEFSLEANVPILGMQAIKFSDKVREKNRQYEFNFNGEVDNGIMISQEEEEAKTNKFTDNQIAQQKPAPQSQFNPSAPAVSQQSARQPELKAPQFVSCPQISQATEVEAELQSRQSKNSHGEAENSQKQVHIINFNGLDQKQTQPQKIGRQTSGSPQDKDGGDKETSQNNSQELQLEIMQSNGEGESSGGEFSEEEDIDRLIVCKIENEFGYPEQYLLSCLQGKIKNDATTCYYLFVKEDKHEVVHLLSESPAQNRTFSKFS